MDRTRAKYSMQKQLVEVKFLILRLMKPNTLPIVVLIYWSKLREAMDTKVIEESRSLKQCIV